VGFATERRLVFQHDVVDRLFSSQDARARTIDATLGELRALPGCAPLRYGAFPMESKRAISWVASGGQPAGGAAWHLPMRNMRGTSPGYFTTIGQRLLRGATSLKPIGLILRQFVL